MNFFSTVVSVISAAPWAILSTRACSSTASATWLDRTIYSTLALGWTTLGLRPPASVMA